MRRTARVGFVAGLAAASLALIATSATADPAATGATLATTGPLTRVHLSKTLQCQVARTNWSGRAFFPPASYSGNPHDGACGTFVGLPGAALYGPALPIPGLNSLDVQSYRPYSAGTQTHLTSGPTHCVQTSVWGDFTVHVRQTDCYATGRVFYTTAIELYNPSGQALSLRLYRVADCRTRGNTNGWGNVLSGSRVFCTRQSSGNTATGWAEGFIPTDADGDYPVSGAKYMEGEAADVWRSMNGISSGGFGNTCCTTSSQPYNNAMGLEWKIRIPPYSWRTRYVRTRF